jgi:hypothetical protein
MILILICSISFMEGFTVSELNVQISPDNQTISIPTNLKTDSGTLNFMGNLDIKNKATMDEIVSNSGTINNIASQTLQIGAASLKHINNQLQIDRPTTFANDVIVDGTLTVTGDLVIQAGGNTWYILIRGGNLHFVKENPDLANYYDHRNNEPHVIIGADGNIWTSRNNFAGWIANSLEYINKINI